MTEIRYCIYSVLAKKFSKRARRYLRWSDYWVTKMEKLSEEMKHVK